VRAGTHSCLGWALGMYTLVGAHLADLPKGAPAHIAFVWLLACRSEDASILATSVDAPMVPKGGKVGEASWAQRADVRSLARMRSHVLRQHKAITTISNQD
jgi:hypothetical protein